MIPANQLPAPHEKYLHNGILLPQIFALVHGYSNDILVFLPIGSNLLPLPNFSDTVDQIPVPCGILKPQLV